MDHKRDSWHLTEDRINKLERMSNFQLNLVLARAYWLKYRRIVTRLFVAALIKYAT